MTLLSRDNLINKFRKEIEDWWKAGETNHGMDTTHIQMASVDEVMAAYGYVPRRLPQYPDITDGRFGYVLAFPSGSKAKFMSLEDAVSFHNGNVYGGNPFRRIPKDVMFALTNRLVDQVGIQRDKSLKGGIKSTKRWIKFCDLKNEYFGIPFDDGLLNKEGK